MKAVRVVIGLVFDDWRLVAALLIGVVFAATLSWFHQRFLGAIVFWLSLPISLWISTNAECKRTLKQGT